MCGFVGYISQNHSSHSESLLRSMSQAIQHRGPDHSGTWVDMDASFCLAFKRLAILDLSEAGNQPMVSSTGRYVIAFNGEIYNYQILKKDLEKEYDCIDWRGSSDTELLLFLIEKYGLNAALQKCVGMFAVALWDRKLNHLSLARDRFGEKPLYYGWLEQGFVFGSDIQSFRKFPNFSNKICKKALGLYLNYSYVPAPLSIYENIFKIEPGQIIKFSSISGEVSKISKSWYWKIEEQLEKSKANPFTSDKEAEGCLHETLRNSVKLQLISDVPLGAFLSGGIDSSLIVSLMQENSIDPVKTFTIGFEDKKFDESIYAKKIANHLRTDHTEVILNPKEALEVIPEIPNIYSEPFADSSQIPTFLVSKIAKSSVTVSLSGDGGDEIFAGYNRYYWGEQIWKKINWTPFWARRSAGRFFKKIPTGVYDSAEIIYNFFRKAEGISFLNDKVLRLSDRLQFINSEESLYTSLCTEWNDVNHLLSKDFQSKDHSFQSFQHHDFLSGVEHMMYWDISSYLKEDILTKVDRAAMANSLETRAPFLDHRVAEVAWRMKDSQLTSNFKGKLPLRRILAKYIPIELYERPKSGFGIPVGDWLRGPLYGWAIDLLDEISINEEGIFNYAAINLLWSQHQSKKFDHTVKLWNILIFRAWMEATKV